MNKFLSSSPLWQTAGLTLIRWMLGAFLIFHGLEIFNEAKMNEYLTWPHFKNASYGKGLAYAGKAAELISGILFVLGLFTRIAALLAAGTMIYITFFLGNGIFWNNDQHPFLFVLLSAVFFFNGPGSFSLDSFFFKKVRR